jgi:hypothetical protein
MKFIEMTGDTLQHIVSDEELQVLDLKSAGIDATTIVRVNQHGDIEIRRPHRWDVIGGLLGNFEDKVKRTTGFDWV